MDFKVFVKEGGAENFVLSLNYYQLNALSTSSILYHLVKAFMIQARSGDQILYLNGCNLQKQTSLFYKTSKASIFNVNDPEGIKYFTRLEQKFRHGFLDTLNPLRNCNFEAEDSEHFFLRCLNFENARRSLFTDISSINSVFKNLPSHLKVQLLLYGDSKLSAIDNNLILKASIKYIMTTNRFSVPLFWYYFLSLALNIYIHFFSSGVHPLPTFFTVLFERAVRYVLVLYFFVSFLVISL